ncbi:MAG: DUF3810 domain-containing protein [Clostridia bacterium]|nr:DUF3810 domain-containing protein [Clostridia bacterium]
MNSANTPEKQKKSRDYEKFPLHAWIFLGLAALSLVLYLIAVASPRFADGFNSTVGAAVRALLAHLTSWIPFSLAEMLIYCIPLLLIGLGIYVYRRRCATWRSMWVFVGCIAAAFSLLFSLFVFSFGTGYHTPTLDERLGLSAGEITAEDLERTTAILTAIVTETADTVTFGDDGFSVMPYDLDTLNDRLLDAYGTVCAEHGFISSLNSRIKPVLASKAMSYTHITGVYSYFTGEANLNVAFPDYTIPYTAAHELAHQRGIARENEANFVAFLVCMASDDPYIRYSGALNLLEYVSSALARADAARYRAWLKGLDARVRGELVAYSHFFDTYRDSSASLVAGAVNDTYLKLHGNEAGTASYGLVVELAVAYFR